MLFSKVPNYGRILLKDKGENLNSPVDLQNPTLQIKTNKILFFQYYSL